MAAVVAVAAVVVLDPFGHRRTETAASWRSDAAPEDLAPLPDAPPARPEPRDAVTTTVLPPPPTTSPPVRLAPPPVAPAEGGEHAYLGRDSHGDPAAWDPCETIEYVVNDRMAPPEGAEILAEAIATVSAATGLVFEDRGATDEIPVADDRRGRDPARYGKAWAPVLIAWTDPDEVPDLADDTAGIGGSEMVYADDGRYERVTGIVFLDGPQLAELLDFDMRTAVVGVVLHELGHLVGLDHVEDPSQVMYHNRDGRGEERTTWNNGDLTGLAALGNGPCNPDV